MRAARAWERLRADPGDVTAREAAAGRAARQSVGRAIRQARRRRAYPDDAAATAPVVIPFPERTIDRRAAAIAAFAAVALVAAILLTGRPGDAPPAAAAPELVPVPAATLAPTGGRGRASASLAPIAALPSPSPLPAPQPSAAAPVAAPPASAPPAGVLGGLPGAAPVGAAGGVPGGTGAKPATPPASPAVFVLPMTPPPFPLGGNRFYFQVVDSSSRAPVANVCVIYGTINCGPTDPHTNVLGFYWLDVTPNASRWSFLFDLDADYWPTTIIASFTPGMGQTPIFVYMRHR